MGKKKSNVLFLPRRRPAIRSFRIVRGVPDECPKAKSRAAVEHNEDIHYRRFYSGRFLRVKIICTYTATGFTKYMSRSALATL